MRLKEPPTENKLGVPEDVAEWFVGLDDGRFSFLSTPLYHQNKNLRTPEELMQTDASFTPLTHLAYQAERGIGQGESESASSLMWTALYDILLEWIDPKNRHLHKAERHLNYSQNDIDHTQMDAYADDLATITGGPNAEYMQQLQATWLSAFCAFTGLVMHPAKIVSTILGPIPSKYTQTEDIGPLKFKDKTDIIVHDHQWNPISCRINAQLGSMKYLGMHLDLRSQSSVSHAQTLQDITDRLSHLMQQPGSSQVKLDYIRFKIFPIALYTASCANWTLAQYRKLDTPFSTAYRQLLTIPSKAPGTLLYLPQDVGGVGLPKFSDKAQLMKWQTFMRCLAVKGAPATSVNEFLARIPQSPLPGNERLTTVAGSPKWPRGKPLTARSTIEWLAESKLSACCRVANADERHVQERNSTSIADLAEDLRLYPSDIYSDEDNAHLPPIRLLATDGSFTVQPRDTSDILTSETSLRDAGTGAGGIVFLPPGYNSDSPTPNGIRIVSDKPEPGMNAFTWELVTQLIGLHFTKHLTSPLVAISDCTSAIARTNRALKTKYNQLANTSGGIFASGAHEFANHRHPKYFLYTQAHPERFKNRREHPTMRDKAICMADAMAGRTKAALGAFNMPMLRYELKLENLFNEIIPIGQWHIRTADVQNFPVMGDLLPYQHRVQLANMTAKRDKHHNHDYWSTTSFSFASKVHPLKNKSHYAAARRSLVFFDWVGHGRNRAKDATLSDEQRAATAKCVHCGQLDSQRHCMLECTHPPFTDIRQAAKTSQALVASKLIKKYPAPCFKHFIQSLCHASWTDATHLERIWLGIWCPDTLQGLLMQPMNTSLTMSERYRYIKLAAQLTAPLIDAYHQLVDITVTYQGRLHHAADDRNIHFTTSAQHGPEHDITTPLPPSVTALSAETRATLEAMHVQEDHSHCGSRLSNLDSVRSTTPFSLSDSAFCLQDADDTF